MTRLTLLITVFLSIIVLNANSLKHNKPVGFFGGRRFGGNVLPPPERVHNRAISFQSFQQKLDHFDPTNTDTFEQRYGVNTNYIDDGERNVAFLFIGGESTASLTWMNYGLWTHLAPEYGALLVQLEHRFYGQSQPFSNLSTENLSYLTSLQALADLAYFIEYANEEYGLSSDVKWILFGGSYAGSLAAWMRLKYPHLVYGSIASSGPLLAELDFIGYFQVVIDDMRLHSEECVDIVQQGYAEIDSLLQNNRTYLADLFNFCDNIDVNNLSNWDIANFNEYVAGIFAVNAQYNGLSASYSIDGLCDSLTANSTLLPVERLAALSANYNYNECINFDYNETVEYYSNEDPSATGGMRQWLFQTCNEFGFYQTSSQEQPVFGRYFPLAFSVQFCIDLFGSQYTENFLDQAIDATNMQYGALDIETDRIFYTYGTIDPWHALGLVNSTNPLSPSILVNGASHCADMYEIGTADFEELQNAKRSVLEQVQNWLD